MRKLAMTLMLGMSIPATANAATLINSLAIANGADLSGLPNGVNTNRFGGFGSDLIFDAASNTYFGMTDRGPGGGTIDFAPRIQQFQVTTNPSTGAISNFSLVNTIVFRQADGITPFSGLNPMALNGSVGTLGASFDPEGLVRLNNGNFLVADEYGPSVYEFSASGTFVRAFATPTNLIPAGASGTDYVNGRPTITSGRQDNRGFEGLTLSPDGNTAYAVLQDPLVNEGAQNDGRRSNNVRMVAFDVATGAATAQYVYQLESIADINPRVPANTFSATNQGRSIGVSAIVALPDGHSFLVLERDNRGLGVDDPTASVPVGTKRIYLIDIANATNVAGISLANSNALPAGTVPVSKALFLDIQAALAAAGLVIPEKIEGLAFGPALSNGGRSLLVVTDNDFSVTQNGSGTQFDVCTSGAGGTSSQVALNAACPNSTGLIPNYLFAFAVSGAEARALGVAAVPEPATWLSMIVGFGMIASFLRRRRRSGSKLRHCAPKP